MDKDSIAELSSHMNPDSWRCSMCSQLGATLVIVPKNHDVQMVEGDDGSWVPLVVKLHPGQCQEAWERYGPSELRGK